MSRPKRPALGRGLGALIPQAPAKAPPAEAEPVDAATAGDVDRTPTTLPIESLIPNPEQPRKHFDETGLAELSESIAAQGIIQPIVVTPLGNGEYQILAGERRWRAAQRAGLYDVPVVVRETPEEQRLELALVENLQRMDLDPLEEGAAYQQIMDLRGYTHAELASRVGKDRSTISNALRLLRLPERVQSLVRSGQLGMGHARALLSLPSAAEMTQLAQDVVRRGMSVRAVEAEVRRKLRGDEPPREEAPEQTRHKIIVADLEDRLRRKLGVKVRLKTGKKPSDPGKLEIPYGDLDELNHLLHILMGEDG